MGDRRRSGRGARRRQLSDGADVAVESRRRRTRRRISLGLLASIFVASGVLHFLSPGPYVSIVPRQLPAPLVLVYISGLAEIAGGLGLLSSRMRRAAGIGLILLLLAVWPANFQMLFDARQRGVATLAEILLWLRLPLQLLLALWVWRASRDPAPLN